MSQILFILPELVGKHILRLVWNVDKMILPWFSSLPTFPLKHKGYYHLSPLCVCRERNCTLCAYASMQKVSEGTENME